MISSSAAPLDVQSIESQSAAVGAGGRGVGVYVWLLGIWLFLELAKPASQTFKLPMLIVAALFVVWSTSTNKVWSRQLVCLIAFLGLMALHVPFARNNFHAFWATYYMLVTLMVACSLTQILDSVARVRFAINSCILAFAYIAAWAVTHSGLGPLGAASGQDENYVSLAMSVGFPLAFFSIFASRSYLLKSLYAMVAVLCALATVVGFSRGGFLGLCAVAAYCWLRSPRRILGMVLIALLGAVVWLAAPAQYWGEMRTIADPNDETADMRIQLWKIAWWQFLDHPIAGVGPGNYKWYAGDYQSEEQYELYERSFSGAYVTHSLYFELLSEMGFAGVLLIGTALAADFRDKRWIAKLRPENAESSESLRQAKHITRGLVAAMIGFLVTSAFLSGVYGSYLWLLLMFTVAIRRSVEPLMNGRSASA